MRRKIFLFGFIISFIAVIVTGIITLLVAQSSYNDEVEHNTKSIASIIVNDVQNSKQPYLYDERAKTLIGDENNIDQRITFIASDGNVLGDSSYDISIMDNHLNRPEVIEANEKGVGYSSRYSDTLNTNMFYMAIKDLNNNIIVRVAMPQFELERVSIKLLIGCGISVLIGTLVSLFLSLLFAKSLSNPIVILANKVKAYAKGQPFENVRLKTNTELDGLMQEFYQMTSSVDQLLFNLSKKNSEFDTVLSSMQDGLIAVDLDLQILYLNPSAKELFNFKELKENAKVTDFIYQMDLLNLIKNCIDEEKTMECKVKMGLEKILDYKVIAHPMRQNKKITGAIILLSDITHMLLLEKLRTDFVANVSHELRTPLASIKGYTESLKDCSIVDKTKSDRFLDIIEIEADRLNVLINDLMELSKIENRSKDINIGMHSFNQILNDIIDVITINAQKKNIEIISDIQHDVRVMVNKDRLKQLLLNLIDNGIKYNKNNGKLWIKAFCLDKNLKINIKDTGEGIDEEDKPRLFERFYRVDKSRSRELGGTGLGLSIVKHIVELYGGSIGVKSVKGEGTEFSVSLPIVF